MEETRFLRAGEIAKRLQLHPATVYRMMQRGELPVLSLGYCKRIPEQAFEKWVEQRTAPKVNAE